MEVSYKEAAVVGVSGVAAGALTYLLGRRVFAALSTGVATSLAVKLLQTNRQLKQTSESRSLEKVTSTRQYPAGHDAGRKLAAMRRTLDEKEKALERAQSEVASLRKSTSKRTSSSTVKAEADSALQNRLRVAEDMLFKKREEVVSLERDIARQSEKLEKVTSENKSFEIALNRLRTTNKGQQEEYEASERACKKAKSELDEVRSEVARLKGEKARLAKSLDVAAERIAEKEAALRDAEYKIKSLTIDIQNLKIEVEDYESLETIRELAESGKNGSVSTSGAAQKDWRARFDTLQASRKTMPPAAYTKQLRLLSLEQNRLRGARMERDKELSAESREHLAKSNRIGRRIDRDLAVLRKNIAETAAHIDGTGKESED